MYHKPYLPKGGRDWEQQTWTAQAPASKQMRNELAQTCEL